MSGHTKGPWVVCTTEDEPGTLFIEQDAENLPEGESDASPIGEVYLCGDGIDADIGAANARLIAAAPSMLEALEEMEKRPIREGDDFDGNDDEIDYLRSMLDDFQSDARAALAEARGDALIGLTTGCDDPALDIEGPGGRTLRDG